MQVTLIDAGTGNLRSVQKALEAVGAKVTLTEDPETVRRGGRLVLPGVGAFGDFMAGLRRNGLEEAVVEIAGSGDALLGICVGMQALFEWSEEMGRHTGLCLLEGKVIQFESLPGLKIPHTGWNQLWPQKPSTLFDGLEPGEYAYYNHSFYCAPAVQEDVLLATDYGISFAGAVQRGNIFGVQFHPEKSQRVGLKILENFLRDGKP
jgi:imidazole glycerol-phosphate synthase subunit HisH